MQRPLFVVKDRFVPTLDHLDERGAWRDKDGLPVLVPTVCDAAGAWRHAWTTHAHCTSYVVPGASRMPRLSKYRLDVLDAIGWPRPVLVWLHFDVDRPGHAPWPEGMSEAELRGVVGGLVAARLPAGWFCYLTRAGYHIVWPLARPVPVDEAEGLLAGMAAELAGRGIATDPACSDWSRLMAMPSVLRDGAQLPARIGRA